MISLHPAVTEAGRSFRLVGLPTPDSVLNKWEVLMPAFPGERFLFVVADIIRCSSTLLTCFAAGLRSATVCTKSGGGTSPEQAELIARTLGSEVVLGGELNGQPIPGGVLGNSPIQAARDSWNGRHLSFSSTNFGAMFTRVNELAGEIQRRGGTVEIVVGALANRDSIVRRIKSLPYDRVAIATGGFYGNASEEDMFFGGDILIALGCEFRQMDDDARLMLFASQAVPGIEERRAHLLTNWIGRALDHFGMADDIDAILSGRHLPARVFRNMAIITPEVVLVHDQPVITTHPAALPARIGANVLRNPTRIHKGEYTHEA